MTSRKKEKKDHLTCCRSTREHHWPLWGIQPYLLNLGHPVAWYGIFVRLVVEVTGSRPGCAPTHLGRRVGHLVHHSRLGPISVVQ